MGMITKDYCIQMTRYNAWQNKQCLTALQALGETDARADCGLFFGSVLATANHLLWADRMWMHRIAGWERPAAPHSESVSVCPTVAVWGSERFHADGLMREWAEGLHALDLTGDLAWESADGQTPYRHNRSLLIVHMFNHQTHHRGQIHAALTQAGVAAPVSDLPKLPDL